MRSSEQYRQFAEECLRLAKQTNNGNHRQVLEEMAKAWSTLAEDAEKNHRDPRMRGSSFLLHEAQIADNGEQPLSDSCFGVAGEIEKSIKFVLVRLHLR